MSDSGSGDEKNAGTDGRIRYSRDTGDNAIAVQNLEKMAKQKQLECSWEQQDEHTYRVFIKAEGAVDEAGKRLQNVSRVSRSPKKQEIQSLCYLLTAWERGMKFLEGH